MKAMWVSGVVVTFAASCAWAGTVVFDPPTAEIDVGEGADLSFDLWVSTEMGFIELLDMILGSSTVPMHPGHWRYSMEIYVAAGSLGPPVYQDVYSYGLDGIGFFAFMGPLASPVHLSTLAIDASGLPVGDHFVLVDGQYDNGRSNVWLGTECDLLFGSAMISVIPEPATLALVGLGAVGLLCGRKRSRPSPKQPDRAGHHANNETSASGKGADAAPERLTI